MALLPSAHCGYMGCQKYFIVSNKGIQSFLGSTFLKHSDLSDLEDCDHWKYSKGNGQGVHSWQVHGSQNWITDGVISTASTSARLGAEPCQSGQQPSSREGKPRWALGTLHFLIYLCKLS